MHGNPPTLLDILERKFHTAEMGTNQCRLSKMEQQRKRTAQSVSRETLAIDTSGAVMRKHLEGQLEDNILSRKELYMRQIRRTD